MYLPRKKFRIFLLLFVGLVFFIHAPLTTAQEDSWVFQDPDNFAKSLDACEGGDVSAECYVKAATDYQINSLNCSLGGYPCSQDENREGLYRDKSVIGQANNLIITLYENPPANTGIWLADVAQNIGIVPKAYAQGIGFSALQPLLSLWKATRNVSYALLIIVLLVIGIMIMLRAKIDPRTVISVQSALPRIVITLILITFSYPIAGFLIDIMYVVLFLGLNLVGSAGGFDAAGISQLQAEFVSGGGIYRIFSSIPTNWVWLELAGLGAFVLSFILAPLMAAGKIGFLLRVKPVSDPITKLLGIGGSVTGLAALIILIAFLFAIIRIFFILLNAYIQLLVNIIFAPILLLGQAIPGQSAFSNWLKTIIANLIVFPATAILIMVAHVVSKEWQASAIPGWTPPMLRGVGQELTEVLIGLGFALVIPQIVMSIKNLFKTKPLIPVGPGALTGPILGGAQQAIQFYYYGSQLFGKRQEAQPASGAAEPRGQGGGAGRTS